MLRIKALTALYAYNRREDNDLAKAEKELMFSIGKTYDLYHYLLLLLIEIAEIADEKIEQALNKKMPTPEDLNPNRRFTDNAIINQLRINQALKKHVSSSKLTWANYLHIPRMLYAKLTSWEPYYEYMNASGRSYQSDKKFITRLFAEFLTYSEDLAACLEEQSIFWNDDMEFVIAMIEKTIRKLKTDSGDDAPLMPLFKNDEDKDFVKILFRKAVMNAKKCSGLIDRNTTNWEVERIALMDILVMQLALTEVMEFSEIPVKVTLNEYIEIAKYYCTSKSSTFVNGILDNIIKEIRIEGLIKKTGRGLLGESHIKSEELN
ncbi:MAG: transcription antitermination factor NusB [Bacteroidales bacterium]